MALALADNYPYLLGGEYDTENHGNNENNGNNGNNNDNGNSNGNSSNHLTGSNEKNRNNGTHLNNGNGNNGNNGNNGSGIYNTQHNTQNTNTRYGSHLQVTREAAHNLVLIYRTSGAIDQALEIMQKYLVF